jgi:hypothetical protein
MRRFSFRLFALGFLIGAIIAAAASVGSAFAAKAAPRAVTMAAQAPDQVIQWNRILLGIRRTPGAQPATVHPTRSMAILHAAVYDAVNAIDRTHADYLVHVAAPPGASEPAAAAAAAHDVLTQLYPGQQATLDSDLAASLATIPDGRPKTDGITGRRARSGGNPGAAGQRRLRSGTDPVRRRDEPRRLPAHPAGIRPTGVHALALRDPVRPAQRQPVPTRAAAGAQQPHLHG